MELVTFDLDGTLISSTVFAAAAEGMGLGEEVAFYDDLYFRGILSLEATFFVEYELFLDRPLMEIHDALEDGPWLDGIEETVQRLRERGLEVWVVTDQPDWAVAFLSRWGIHEGVCTSTRLWGDRVGPVDEHAFEKWPALEQRLDQAGIDPSQVCHVGNGSNDVPVFEQVGRAIALNPSEDEVGEAADVVLRVDDLRRVLDHVGPDAKDRDPWDRVH